MDNEWLRKDFILINIEEAVRHKNELIEASKVINEQYKIRKTKKLYQQLKLIEDVVNGINKDIDEYRRELRGQ